MSPMPAQKPGRSRQDYGTPPLLLAATMGRLSDALVFDLACRHDNAVCDHGYYFDEGVDALQQAWADDVRQRSRREGAWAWLNPPFADIEPWVKKAGEEAARGLHLAMLVPASVGSQWWRRYVEPDAYALYLNPRITFVGATDPYPKDCAILIYTPLHLTGAETWEWQKAA